MDSTVYIAIFIILILVVFGMVLSWSNHHKKGKEGKKLLDEFDNFVMSHNLAIDKKQTLNKNMIGIDRLNLKLVFLDKSKKSLFHLIDLEEIKTCRLIRSKNNSNGHIKEISLHCIFKQKDKPVLVLPFYNAMKDDLFKMMRLSKKAAYWEKSINIFKETAELSLK
ncbi:MAG: hypothetical protein ABI325_04980 [Ginsengibacter sp.]